MIPLLLAFVLGPLAAYLVGSIPVGFLYAKARGVDIRTVGSGNIGATNVGRAFGPRHFFVVFLLDVLKGAGPSVGIMFLLPVIGLDEQSGAVHYAARLVVALAAICGHVFTCWLGFKGGKGVATSLGCMLGTWPHLTWPALIALGVWGVVAWISRYVSLSSMVASVAFCIAYVAMGYWRQPVSQLPLLAFALLVPTLILLTHRSNIRRLMAGNENRIGQRIDPPTPEEADRSPKTDA